MRTATLGIGVWVAAAVTMPGCVELAALLADELVGENPANVSDPPGADDNLPPGDPDTSPSDPPVANLSVSNPNPLPGEEVRLTCTLRSGSDDDVTFAFQPTTARLTVDSQRGTASFVVDQSEVGIETRFTCTATNSAGTSAASNPVTVIAADPGPAAFP